MFSHIWMGCVFLQRNLRQAIKQRKLQGHEEAWVNRWHPFPCSPDLTAKLWGLGRGMGQYLGEL